MDVAVKFRDKYAKVKNALFLYSMELADSVLD